MGRRCSQSNKLPKNEFRGKVRPRRDENVGDGVPDFPRSRKEVADGGNLGGILGLLATAEDSDESGHTDKSFRHRNSQ